MPSDRELLTEALAVAHATLTEWSPASRAKALVSRRKSHGGMWGRNLAHASPPDADMRIPSRATRTKQRTFGGTSPAQRAYQIDKLTARLRDASPEERQRLLDAIARLRSAQLGVRSRVLT